MDDVLLTPDDVVQYLRLDAGGKNGRERLRNLRRRRRIGYIKSGRLIRYRREDVKAFERQNARPAIEEP